MGTTSPHGVLREDTKFNTLLGAKEEYRRKWHLIPGRSETTDAGHFALGMCQLDWHRPGGPLGSIAWETYTDAAGFEMLFTDLCVEKASRAVSSVEADWVCHRDVGSRRLRRQDVAALIFRVKQAGWTIISRAFHNDRDIGFIGLAEAIHGIPGATVIGISGRDLIELRPGVELVRQHYADWEQVPHDRWLTERKVAVPPFICTNDDEEYFQMWLAGIPISDIGRLDVFTYAVR